MSRTQAKLPSKLDAVSRDGLLSALDTQRTYRNEWLRRQIVDNQRIDLLATEVMGLKIQPFHFALQRFQFLHPHSLQLAFRGAGKTTSCTVTKVIHLLASNRNLRILIASKTKRNAETFLKEIKQHLESNKYLIELFGQFYDPYKVTKWDNTEIEVLGRTSIMKEASVTCVGVDSAVVSRHYDVIICDDLVDEENARTKAMREKTRIWYYQTLDPTLEPPDPAVRYRGERHVLGTRYHYDDLYGHLSSNELKDHHQIIPALDENLESPWPEKYPPKWLLAKKSNAGLIIFNAQYQCHSADTEFLTEHGWRLWDQVADSDKLATFNLQTEQLEYELPTGRTCLPYKGELLALTGHKTNALITPNHRMIGRPSDYSKDANLWRRFEAQELYAQASKRTGRVTLPTRVQWDGKPTDLFTIPAGHRRDRYGAGVWDTYSAEHHGTKLVPMPIFMRFLGWFIAEGSTTSARRGAVALSQNEGVVLDEMRSTLLEMGFEPREYKKGRVVKLVVNHIGLWEWLREHVKTCSADARIPRQFLALDSRQLRTLFDALIDGDGHVVANKKCVSYQYSTASKQLSDDVMELGLKLGLDSSVRYSPPRAIKINGSSSLQRYGSWRVLLRTAIGNGIDPVRQLSSVAYYGNVVCFQVPNGTLITRRGGKILISGNCDCEAMKGEIFRYDDCQQLREDEWPSEANLKIFMGVDLAIKESESADQFAIVVVGVEGKIGSGTEKYYVLDYYAGHLRFSQQTDKIISMYKQWKPITGLVEANAYQLAQFQELKRVHPDIRLRPHITDKDKMTRAWKLSPLFESGRVFFRKDSQGTMIDQLVLFPNHKFKDLFDALDMAIGAAKKRKRDQPTRREPGVL